MATQRCTSTSIHKHTLFLYFSDSPTPPPRLFIESNKQNKQTTLSKSNKTRLTQNNKCTQEMQDERMNHLEESFTFQTGDLEGEDASFSFSFSFFLFETSA